MLVIDPDECIDCTLCVQECPARAIFPEDELLPGQAHFAELNRELSQAWPVLSHKIPAPEDAKQWDGIPDKLPLLER